MRRRNFLKWVWEKIPKRQRPLYSKTRVWYSYMLTCALDDLEVRLSERDVNCSPVDQCHRSSTEQVEKKERAR